MKLGIVKMPETIITQVRRLTVNHESACRAKGGVARRISCPIRTRVGYSLLFGALFVMAWIPSLVILCEQGKSFFWSVDGLSQQYVWFVYTGQWLREAFSSVFVEHTLDIPLWTMDSGFGVDVIQALICTAINPFYAVSALVPQQWAEEAFEASMLACLYCSGLAFSAWCVGRGIERRCALAGALAYVFSGNVVSIFSQPGFLFPVLAFPLALWAADRIFARRSPVPYIAILAWALAFSFYDAYMILLLLVLYCLATFFWRVDRGLGSYGRLRRLAGWTGRFLLYTALAVLVSCTLFLPQAMSLVGSDRLELDRTVGALYSAWYYINFLMGITTYSFAGGDAYVGLSAIAPLAVLVLVLHRKEHGGVLVSFAVLTVMLMLPAFGRLMNAMEYPTCRWSWAYSLCAAYAVAVAMPAMSRMARGERRVVAVVAGIYVLCCLLLPVSGRTKLAALVLAASLAMCLATSLRDDRFPAPVIGSVPASVTFRFALSMAVCVAVSGAMSFAWFLAPGLGEKSQTLVDAGTLWSRHAEDGASGLVARASAGPGYDGSYRYDRTAMAGCAIHNSNLITGLMAPDFYNSIYNDGVDELLTSLGLTSTEGANNRFGSLDSRSALEAMFGVRYFCIGDDELAMLPYTFRSAEKIASSRGESGGQALYETDRVLPIAFNVDSYLTVDDYYALPVEARQEALLSGAVLDSGSDVPGVSRSDGIDTSVSDVPYEVTGASGCEVCGDTIIVKDGGATLQLSFNSPADSETYLVFRGMDFRELELGDRYSEQEWDDLGVMGEAKAVASEVLQMPATNGFFFVGTDGSNVSRVYYPNSSDPIFGGVRDWVCNLGYSEDSRTEATLTFEYPGVYTFDDISVASFPMSALDQRLEVLEGGAASDVEIGTNLISCTSSSETDSLLVLSVAYSDGWSATVDGVPADIYKADLGFMSVRVPAGTHEVVLTYRTPYLLTGAILSGLGFVGCAALVMLRRRHRPRRARRAAAFRLTSGMRRAGQTTGFTRVAGEACASSAVVSGKLV